MGHDAREHAYAADGQDIEDKTRGHGILLLRIALLPMAKMRAKKVQEAALTVNG